MGWQCRNAANREDVCIRFRRHLLINDRIRQSDSFARLTIGSPLPIVYSFDWRLCPRILNWHTVMVLFREAHLANAHFLRAAAHNHKTLTWPQLLDSVWADLQLLP